MSESKIGKNNPMFGKCQSEEVKKKISLALKGKPKTKEHIEKIKNNNARFWKNKKKSPITEETRNKIRMANLGEKSHFWRGGISPTNEIIRRSARYRLWRIAVFERDNYICQKCSERGGKLHADHIKMFALFPDLRFSLNNGQTLCEECHKEKTSIDNSFYSFQVLNKVI